MLSLPKFFADTHLFFFSPGENEEIVKIKDWDSLGVWNCVDCRSAFRDDDELRVGNARFELSNRANVRPCFRSVVGIADYGNLGFVLEDTVDVSVEIRVSEIVVEHSHWQIEVEELSLLVCTVFPKSGEISEGQCVDGKGHAMEDRHVFGLSSVGVGFRRPVAGRR
jgi:hypothetical protein